MATSALEEVVETKEGKEIDLEQSEDHIRVVARFRPINAKERHEEKLQNLSSKPISLYNNSCSVTVPRHNKPPLQFTLDDIIWSDSTQQQAFDTLAKPLIDQVIKGYNCTIFAFGQTGSGKTYTMFGPDNYSQVEQLGIIPRSVDYLFSSLSEAKDILNYQVTLSVIEIYKEQTRDLLNTAKKRKRLEIFVSGKEVIIKNLTEQSCKGVDDLLSFILKAQAARKTKATDFIGHHSSRSHCVVMIYIMQRLLDETVKTSKMNFGDLAGSELAARTGAVGDTLKEAGKIHQGLLALENVINSLVQQKEHIPYKDSNLTRVLKDSLGGNSKTTLLIACSPHIWNRAETVSTLRFASRAKKIKNKAQINKRRTRDQMELRIQQLEDMNLSLKKKLKIAKKKNNGHNVQESIGSDIGLNDDIKLKEALTEIENLKELLRKKEEIIQQIEQDLKSKDNIIDEMNNEYTKRIKIFENDINCKNNMIEELENNLFENENEIKRLNNTLENDQNLQNSFIEHKQQLSNMVNETITDQTTATVSALSELQKQQETFYKFMKSMQCNIDKIYQKQYEHDKKFEELQNKKLNIIHEHNNNNYNDDDDDNDEFMDDIELNERMNNKKKEKKKERNRLSTSSIIIVPDSLLIDDNNNDKEKPLSPRTKEQVNASKEAFGNVIFSMKSYLERSRTGRLNVNELKKDANIAMIEWNEDNENDENDENDDKSPINLIESVSDKIEENYQLTEDEDIKEEDIKTKIINNNNNNNNDYSIGKEIDVLDSSYHWYSAQIIDIDVFNKKALKVHYDGFDDKWDEWIPFKKQFRTAPHKTKSLGNGKNKGGIHALIATKYGRSRNGKDLRMALDINTDKLLNEINILLQGYLWKRGNWNKDWKKRWFILRNTNNLYYYEHQNLKQDEYRGVIALSNIRKIVSVNSGFTHFSFDIQTPSRIYHFSCQNQSDINDWMNVLECLMNNPLDTIAPKIKNNDNNNNNNNNKTDHDPNRFKHQSSKSTNFHKLTVTTPNTPNTTNNNNNNISIDIDFNKKTHKKTQSVIGRLVRSASKLTIKKNNNNNNNNI